MKIEDAIHELILQKDNPYDREVTDKTCDVAIVALEKQMPKEVLNQNGTFGTYIYGDCPSCARNKIIQDNYYLFCPSCGQALKWGG